MLGSAPRANMADRSKTFLTEVRKCPGNDRCADCNRQDPGWAVWNLGIFVCESCGNIHRSLGTHISRVKSVNFDKWDEDQLRMMEAQGNLKSKRYYEQQVPACYKLPTPKDPACPLIGGTGMLEWRAEIRPPGCY
ncbi:Stromal membrane-associated protein 2 [Lamellibrachia satsuma]|nr:Stromal membrane-associated protein 2 [Lamellibrachia satsuma]